TDLGQLDGVNTGAISRIFFDVAPVAFDGGIIAGAQFNGFGGTGQAAYSFTRGVILYQPTIVNGTLLDNFGTDGTPPTGSAVSANALFVTTGPAIAKLGAAISGLTLDAGGIVLRGGVYGAAGANANSPSDTLSIINSGTVVSQNGSKTIGLDVGTLSAKLNVTSSGVTFNTISDLDVAAGVEITGAGLITKNGAGTMTINGA